MGAGVKDIEKIDGLYDGDSSYGTDAVILGIRKALISFDELALGE